VKIIKTISLVARGPRLVESCHAKWRHWIAAQWPRAPGTGMQTVASLGTPAPQLSKEVNDISLNIFISPNMVI